LSRQIFSNFSAKWKIHSIFVIFLSIMFRLVLWMIQYYFILYQPKLNNYGTDIIKCFGRTSETWACVSVSVIVITYTLVPNMDLKIKNYFIFDYKMKKRNISVFVLKIMSMYLLLEKQLAQTYYKLGFYQTTHFTSLFNDLPRIVLSQFMI